MHRHPGSAGQRQTHDSGDVDGDQRQAAGHGDLGTRRSDLLGLPDHDVVGLTAGRLPHPYPSGVGAAHLGDDDLPDGDGEQKAQDNDREGQRELGGDRSAVAQAADTRMPPSACPPAPPRALVRTRPAPGGPSPSHVSSPPVPGG